MNRMCKEQVIEIDAPPRYEYGQKVRSRKNVRNDGTFYGVKIGDVLIRKGDVGFVNSIGTFLQQFYIYGVEFYEQDRVVGMRAKELELVED
jgi:nitrogen fixation protein NifZ